MLLQIKTEVKKKKLFGYPLQKRDSNISKDFFIYIFGLLNYLKNIPEIF